MRQLWCMLLLFVSVVPQAFADEPLKLPAKEKLHLYLLIGQSNMAGRGVIEEVDKQAHPRVIKFTKEETWAPGLDPLHFDKPMIAGVGLGSAFARTMADADDSVVIGLVPCAVGGTPLSRWQKGGDLYKQAVARAKAAMKDGTLKGILWHQGEADAGSETTAKNYGERLSRMVRDLRAELGAGDVPFVAGKLGEFLKSNSQLVNEQLDTVPKQVPNAAVVSSKDLNAKSDRIHFDSPSLREFGKRYAAAMQKLQSQK